MSWNLCHHILQGRIWCWSVVYQQNSTRFCTSTSLARQLLACCHSAESTSSSTWFDDVRCIQLLALGKTCALRFASGTEQGLILGFYGSLCCGWPGIAMNPATKHVGLDWWTRLTLRGFIMIHPWHLQPLVGTCACCKIVAQCSIMLYFSPMLGNKLFPQMGSVSLFVLAAESFDTQIRATGTALALGVGRLGACLAPMVYESRQVMMETEQFGTVMSVMLPLPKMLPKMFAHCVHNNI